MCSASKGKHSISPKGASLKGLRPQTECKYFNYTPANPAGQDRRKGQRDWRPAARCSVCQARPNAEDKLVQSKHLHFPHSWQAIRKGNHQDTLFGKRLGIVLMTERFDVSCDQFSQCERHEKGRMTTEQLGLTLHLDSGLNSPKANSRVILDEDVYKMFLWRNQTICVC